MSAELWLGALASAGLAAYLVYAILHPEKF
jgi:K+-transporting ATPase KdpF subunit